MAESTLSLRRDDLRKAAAIVLGYGVSADGWDAEQLSMLDYVIADGLREFYYPGTEGTAEPYEWSFLRKMGTITTSASDYDYTLPDDCAGIIRRMVFTSGAQSGSVIQMVDMDYVRHMRHVEEQQNGIPTVAAVRVVATTVDSSAGQRWEVLLYPTPNAAFKIEYQYPALPNAPSGTANDYVLGGMQHAATIKAMVSAAAERIKAPEQMRWSQEAARLLAASLEADRAIKRTSETGWLKDEPEYGTFDWLMQQTGGPVYGWNPKFWQFREQKLVTSWINRGYRSFVNPPPLPGAEGAPPKTPHMWSFRNPIESVNVVCGNAQYDMPPDFNGIIGEVHYTAAQGKRSMRQIHPSEWQALQATNDNAVALQTAYHAAQAEAFAASYADPTDDAIRAAYGAAYTTAYNAVIALKGTIRAADNAGYSAGINAAKITSGDSGGVGLLAALVVAQASADGYPKYYAVATVTESGRDRKQLWLYPTPAVDFAITFRYIRHPDDLGPANQYPVGGREHAETILAASQAVSAEGTEKYPDAWGRFMQKLASSITSDKALERAEVSAWALSSPTEGTYEWLQQEIGLATEIGPNFNSWSTEQERQVDSIIQRGLQQFYMPPPTGRNSRAHVWSWLNPQATLQFATPVSGTHAQITDGVMVLTSGESFPAWAEDGEVEVGGTTYQVASVHSSYTELTLTDATLDKPSGTSWTIRRPWYTLEASIRAINGPIVYSDNQGYRQKITSRDEADLRAMSQRGNSGLPQYYGLSRKLTASGAGSERLLFWPCPDTAEVVTYRYTLRPGRLLATKSLLCGAEHYETALASCLSIADPRRMDRFMQLLEASIDIDQGEHNAASLGINHDQGEMRSDWPYGRLSANFEVQYIE